MDEFAAIERQGANAGLNPMFGEWQQGFNFPPVPYTNGGVARAQFRERVRSQLKNQFVYVGQVSLRVTLYLEEEKVLETPAYGDLDNHAKSLLDALKGSGGILIDDCQIQHLDISWIDVPHTPRFDVEVKSGPDDFLLTPLDLYEMPDGLYYPVPQRAWTTEGPKELSDSDRNALIEVTAEMTRGKKQLRHSLRQTGAPQFRAFQASKYIAPTLTGFHRTRVEACGFRLVPIAEWRKST